MEDNMIIEEIEFSEEEYKKNIKENKYEEEYERGEINGDN